VALQRARKTAPLAAAADQSTSTATANGTGGEGDDEAGASQAELQNALSQMMNGSLDAKKDDSSTFKIEMELGTFDLLMSNLTSLLRHHY